MKINYEMALRVTMPSATMKIFENGVKNDNAFKSDFTDYYYYFPKKIVAKVSGDSGSSKYVLLYLNNDNPSP